MPYPNPSNHFCTLILQYLPNSFRAKPDKSSECSPRARTFYFPPLFPPTCPCSLSLFPPTCPCSLLWFLFPLLYPYWFASATGAAALEQSGHPYLRLFAFAISSTWDIRTPPSSNTQPSAEVTLFFFHESESSHCSFLCPPSLKWSCLSRFTFSKAHYHSLSCYIFYLFCWSLPRM